MTPQEINTIMRALGRIEGRLDGIEGNVDRHSGQLGELLDTAAEARGVVTHVAGSRKHRAALIAGGLAAIGAATGAVQLLVAWLHS